MKNQYFGDISDYMKYGLLRALQSTGDSRLLVAWLLTPDDNKRDGRFRSYLQEPDKWKRFDPKLYSWLASKRLSTCTPRVSLIEESRLLPRARFYSALVPDKRDERDRWREGLLKSAEGMDLVFLDPDNGIEVKSKPIGYKGSSKYVSWREISDLWSGGCSVLIYQHFPHVPRDEYAQRMMIEVKRRTGATLAFKFRTAHVLFLLAIQKRHEKSLRNGVSSLRNRWGAILK